MAAPIPASYSRLYAGPADLARVVAFVRAVRPPERAADHPTVVHLPEALQLAHNQATLRLWFDGEQLAAYAFVDVFQTLRFDLDPRHATPALQAALLAWGDAVIRQAVPAGSQLPGLYASCHSDDAARLDFLTQAGFIILDISVLHLERPLALTIAAPQLPPGFTLRPLAGMAEAAEAAAVHCEAFGTAHMTTARRLAMLRAPEYDPGLDLVVSAPNGDLAACGLGAVHSEENALTGRNACYTDLFATRAAYRGRGLALALLLTLLRRLQPRGFEIVKLNTSSGNAAMRHVAGLAGFSVVSRTLLLERPVTSPAPPALP